MDQPPKTLEEAIAEINKRDEELAKREEEHKEELAKRDEVIKGLRLTTDVVLAHAVQTLMEQGRYGDAYKFACANGFKEWRSNLSLTLNLLRQVENGWRRSHLHPSTANHLQPSHAIDDKNIGVLFDRAFAA